MPSVAVWEFAGHGTAGILAFYKQDSAGKWYVQQVEAAPYRENCASQSDPNGPYIPFKSSLYDDGRFYVNKLLGSQMDYMRMALLLSCRSFAYRSGHYGDQKYSLGFLLRNEKFVDVVIGVTYYTGYEDLDLTGARSWSSGFHYNIQQGARVDGAIAAGKQQVLDYWGEPLGTQNIQAVGRTNESLWPASWGRVGY